jgi:hypothetical protein
MSCHFVQRTEETTRHFSVSLIGFTTKLQQCVNHPNHRLYKKSYHVSKPLFIVPTDAHYYKIIEKLKRYKNCNTCSDMFRFTQELSSGSSPVLS